MPYKALTFGPLLVIIALVFTIKRILSVASLSEKIKNMNTFDYNIGNIGTKQKWVLVIYRLQICKSVIPKERCGGGASITYNWIILLLNTFGFLLFTIILQLY
jgi:hypothetical protein